MAPCRAVDLKWSWLALSSYPFTTTMGTSRLLEPDHVIPLDTWTSDGFLKKHLQHRWCKDANCRATCVLGVSVRQKQIKIPLPKLYIKIWISTGICGLDFCISDLSYPKIFLDENTSNLRKDDLRRLISNSNIVVVPFPVLSTSRLIGGPIVLGS